MSAADSRTVAELVKQVAELRESVAALWREVGPPVPRVEDAPEIDRDWVAPVIPLRAGGTQ